MSVYIFMAFIWIIGWLYSCGLHQSCWDKVGKGKVQLFGGWVMLIIIWPFYLGYKP